MPSSSSAYPADAAAAELPDLLTISQAAAHLGVSRISVWRWVRDGALPAVRVGQRITRIAQADVDSILVSLTSSGRLATTGQGPAAAPLGLDDLAPREHLVQFYERDQALLAAVVPFIADGLTAAGSAIVVATRSHRAAIQRGLRAAGIDVSRAHRSGRYQSLDALATLASFMVDGQPDPERFRQAIGGLAEQARAAGRPVRIFGEMVALLVLEGNEQATMALEELWNDLQSVQEFQLFCGYPIDALADESLGNLVQQVCAVHTRAAPAESFTQLASERDRLTEVVRMQQRVAALERELAERRQAEHRLRQALRQERSRRSRVSPSGEAVER